MKHTTQLEKDNLNYAYFHIRILERNGVVGGCMAIINISGDIFEVGASILHPKNFYALEYPTSLVPPLKKLPLPL
ncbi:Prenylcysteine oxidase [Parasponia andersonii]|uniref:Prenylcysteine oxidase n=1 Tax=Parasponia andersonii TaxID=3476 RepID=A0A2P5BPN7_PARAD|nr:Prenylcysteine oxidase [Parasponia andersonii]